VSPKVIALPGVAVIGSLELFIKLAQAYMTAVFVAVLK
jgi:hypothetical protein